MAIKIPDLTMLNDKYPEKMCIHCGEGIFALEFRTEVSYLRYKATGFCLKCQQELNK